MACLPADVASLSEVFAHRGARRSAVAMTSPGAAALMLELSRKARAAPLIARLFQSHARRAATDNARAPRLGPCAQVTALTATKEELEKKLRLKNEELALAQNADAMLREQLKARAAGRSAEALEMRAFPPPTHVRRAYQVRVQSSCARERAVHSSRTATVGLHRGLALRGALHAAVRRCWSQLAAPLVRALACWPAVALRARYAAPCAALEKAWSVCVAGTLCAPCFLPHASKRPQVALVRCWLKARRACRAQRRRRMSSRCMLTYPVV